jgi:endoglucanase
VALRVAASPRTAAASTEAWTRFRDRFVTADGRVLDTGNGGVSHSEGQGWGLLLAVAFDDRATFRLLHGWTRRMLARPSDALSAWRYRPGHVPPVDDPNNATDGDLYIAWALARAGRRWGDPALTAAAATIARDLLRLLTREVAGGRWLVLLPGVAGFEDARRTVLNPSYMVFPAYGALDQVLPDPRWARLTADGLSLLRHARFGRWGLPPDWLAVGRGDGALAPAEGWPPRFSFDAVRVPLLLAWAGRRQEPAAQAALRFWTDPSFAAPPAWADLRTDAVAGYPASGGVAAIASLVAGRPFVAALAPSDDYYASALKMLAGVAVNDIIS